VKRSCVDTAKSGADPGPGTVQPGTDCPDGDAERGSYLGVGEVRPGDQEQDLAVALGEGGQGRGQIALRGREGYPALCLIVCRHLLGKDRVSASARIGTLVALACAAPRLDDYRHLLITRSPREGSRRPDRGVLPWDSALHAANGSVLLSLKFHAINLSVLLWLQAVMW
jgi:hypothetical protein